MNKKFWEIVISFWSAIIIAGICTFFYIQYSQHQERKQFVAQFNYDEEEDSSTEKLSSYPTVQYEPDIFVHTLQDFTAKMNEYETTVAKYLQNEGDKQEALSYTLQAYQATKDYMQQFGNVEILNSSLLERKQYEKMSIDAYNYLQAASIYYIVSAKKMKHSTETLNEQLSIAKKNLSSLKAQLLTEIEVYK